MQLSDYDKNLLVQMLSQVDFLVYHTPEEINQILENIERLECPAGALIVKQGQERSDFYIVGSGAVSIFSEKSGTRRHMAELQSGGYFGEMSLLTNSRCNADVEAQSDSVIYRLPGGVFFDLIRKNPTLADNISRAISQRRQERQSVLGVEENVDMDEQYRRVKETLKHLVE